MPQGPYSENPFLKSPYWDGSGQIAAINPDLDRTLYVPLSFGKIAAIPYPMTQAAFTLLLDSLNLWKRALVYMENPSYPPSADEWRKAIKRLDEEMKKEIAAKEKQEPPKPGRDFDFEPMIGKERL